MIYSDKVKMGFSDIEKDMFLSNKTILKFFEDVTGYFADTIGNGVEFTVNNHKGWVLLDWKVKVLNRPKYGEKLTVKTWARTIDKYFSNRDYEIINKYGKTCVIATSKWLYVDTQNLSFEKITEQMKIDYSPEPNIRVFDEELAKLEKPMDFDNVSSYQITRRDLDHIGHVHNTHYIDLAYVALPDDVYEKRLFNNIRINYKKEIRLNDKILLKYKFKDKKHIVVIENENGTLHSIIELY